MTGLAIFEITNLQLRADMQPARAANHTQEQTQRDHSTPPTDHHDARHLACPLAAPSVPHHPLPSSPLEAKFETLTIERAITHGTIAYPSFQVVV